MTTARRFDYAPMSGARFDSTTGFLHAPIRATRTGVFAYRMKDGSTSYELRHPEDVFEPESLESLKRIVLTRGHPRDSKGLPLDVTADNVRKLQVGHGGDTIRRETVADEDHPVIDGTVTDPEVTKSIVSKRRTEVSMGYTIELVDEVGEYKGQRYTKRHKRIRYNHCAVDIDAGRGGPTVSLQLDDADAVIERTHHTEDESRRDQAMVKIKIDGVEVELEAGAASIIQRAMDRRDGRIDALQADLKTVTGAKEAAEARADQAEKDRKTAEEDAAKKADSGNGAAETREVLDVLVGAAKLVELTAEKRDALLDLAGEGSLPAKIRRAVVLEKCADEKDRIEKKSDEYFEARFDALVRAVPAKAEKSDADDRFRRQSEIIVTAGGKLDEDDDPETDRVDEKDLPKVLDSWDPISLTHDTRSVARF